MKNPRYTDKDNAFISCDLENGSSVSFSATTPNEWLAKFIATKQTPAPWVDPVTPQDRLLQELRAVDLHEIVAALVAATDPKVIDAMPTKAKDEVAKLTAAKAALEK